MTDAERLADKIDALTEAVAGLRADVRELRVRQENHAALVREYVRRLNEHVREDEDVSDRVGALEVWRGRAQGFGAGVLAAGSLVGAALGALVTWLLGR